MNRENTAVRATPWPGIAVGALLASLVLGGCASMQPEEGAEAATESPAESSPAAAADTAAAESLSGSARELATARSEQEHPKVTKYRGTDQLVKLPPKQEPVRLVGEDVSLNFEQAPLGEVVHAIIGDILGLDYIIDHPVKGEVTLRTRTPIPRDQLLGILESLLKAHKVLMIRGDDGRYLISGSPEATTMSPALSNPEDSAAGYSTIIVPLQYISAAAMADILRPVATEKALVRVDNTRNLLMLAGTRAQLSGWLDIVATFDIDMLKGMSVGLFPLENTSVEEIDTILKQMLGGAGGKDGGSDIARVVKVIPVRRLNSILVVTPRAHYLDTIETWLERLDGEPDSLFEKRLYVYPVQNTTAARLAKLLTGLYAGGTPTTGGGRQVGGSSTFGSGGYTSRPGVAPGMSPETLGSSSAGSGSLRSGGSSSLGGGSTGSGVGGSGGSGMSAGVSSSFGSRNDERNELASANLNTGDGGAGSFSDVRVVADDENNALMIYATGKQYQTIEDALLQLDVVATQVIIEASIVEVTLTEDLTYGLEWTFKAGLGGDYDSTGTLAQTALGPIARTGFSYSVTNSAGEISAVLNALAEESLINVISSPSVMVLDNNTAYIHVGNQVPTLQGTTISDGGNRTENIVYRDTGVKLTVKPSVNAGGLVTMDVEQSVTDTGTVDVATGQRSFLERNIMSRVAVRSGESVVLGGLIRENASEGDSGVPLLHKIPVVGSLFGTTVTSSNRTELLVIITPRALFNEEELRQVSEEMRSQVRNLELIDADI